jgi:hypothetical protein
MRNSKIKSIAGVMACCLVLAIASPVFAQSRGYGYGNRNRTNVERLIRQAENRSDQFVRTFDLALDRSRFDGRLREDRLNERALELERHLNMARQAVAGVNNNHFYARSHIANAINVAQGINTVMRNRRLMPQSERQWVLLRSDLNRLAAIYNLRQLR